MTMFIMYLRKETRRMLALNGFHAMTENVVAYYKDKEATKQVCVNFWDSKPDKRNKYVMYNCAKYKAVWLDDKKEGN